MAAWVGRITDPARLVDRAERPGGRPCGSRERRAAVDWRFVRICDETGDFETDSKWFLR